MQKIIFLTTVSNSVRSSVDSWGAEDADLFVSGKPIGLTPSPHCPYYENVLEAMADGWRLLAMPVKTEYGYDWWLVKG